LTTKQRHFPPLSGEQHDDVVPLNVDAVAD
jgi:hypothetical protein